MKIINSSQRFGRKYSAKTQDQLGWLESRCEYLPHLLEEYRHLQPDGKAFSEKTIGRIFAIHEANEEIWRHQEEIKEHQKTIDRYNYEIECIEKDVPILPEVPFNPMDVNNDF